MSESSHHILQNFDLAEGFAAATQWWELAGVDCDFAGAATTWLAPEQRGETAAPAQEAPPPQTKTAPQEPANALERALAGKAHQQIAPMGELPADLAAFHAFWMDDASLAPLAPTRRIAPIGSAHADLMVLVAQPDQQDSDQLLSGPQGQVLQGILRAMQIDPAQTYRASVLPSVMPMPDWEALASQGLGTLTQHHMRLAVPKRAIVFGRALQGLIGEDAQDLPPIMFAPSLDNLARSAGRRERFWNQWLDWTA